MKMNINLFDVAVGIFAGTMLNNPKARNKIESSIMSCLTNFAKNFEKKEVVKNAEFTTDGKSMPAISEQSSTTTFEQPEQQI